MRHWLYGAGLSVLLLLFLFAMLYVYYSVREEDCLNTLPSVRALNASDNFGKLNDSTIDAQKLTFDNNNNNNVSNRKGFWTIRGYRSCAEKLSTEGNALWKMKPCPKPFDEGYCFNGGECVTFDDAFKTSSTEDEFENSFVILCKCAINFQGTRCEVTYDSDAYGYNVERNEVETAALSTLVTVLIICLLAISCCFYVYRKYGKQGDFSSFKTFSTAFQSTNVGISSGSGGSLSTATSANNFDRRRFKFVPCEERLRRSIDATPAGTVITAAALSSPVVAVSPSSASCYLPLHSESYNNANASIAFLAVV